MKQQKWQDGLIKRWRKAEGSMVVEASIVLPVFLLFVLFLVCLVRLAAVEMALHSTGSQVVRQSAANIRPVLLVMQQGTNTANSLKIISDIPRAYTKLPDWNEAVSVLAGKLPEPAGTLVQAAVTGNWKPAEDLAATEGWRLLVEPLLRQYAEQSLLDPDRIKLVHLSLPDLSSRDNAYLIMELEYTFPLRVPLLNKPIKLRQTVMERVWASDALPANYTEEDEEQGESTFLQILSVEPSPVKPGHKATAVAKTNPGAEVTLEVLYKSGKSVAKHIGKATAGADGYVEWTWLVSGNTTLGTWEVRVTAADGTSSSLHFNVSK